jgi:hypothetical protein
MVKAKQKSRQTVRGQNLDGVFLLKMVLYLVLGSMWLKLSHHNTLHIPLPIGFAVGIIFASHEHFQIDRKLEYTLLLAALLIGYVAPFGLYINF